MTLPIAVLDQLTRQQEEIAKLREESTAFQNQCISLKHKNHLLREQRDRLVDSVRAVYAVRDRLGAEVAHANVVAILAEIEGEKK